LIIAVILRCGASVPQTCCKTIAKHEYLCIRAGFRLETVATLEQAKFDYSLRVSGQKLHYQSALIERFVIIIIMWLVRCWTLPFLRVFSRLDDPALDDWQLPDQCWVVLYQIQRSGARCDMVSRPLAKVPHRPWVLNCGL